MPQFITAVRHLSLAGGQDCIMPHPSFMENQTNLNNLGSYQYFEEPKGSEIECPTRDQGVAGSRLTRGTVPCH